MKQKYDVFISYSRANLEKVKSIKAEIERSTGVRCWMDLEGIESGVPRFTRSIIEGIKQCQIFLFMCSAQSQSSEFALRELNFADKRCPHIIIVHIDAFQMNEEFEFLYGLTDAIDWNNLPQREKLLRDVKKWIGDYKKDDIVKFEKTDIQEKDLSSNLKIEKNEEKEKHVVRNNIITLKITDEFDIVLKKDYKNDIFIGNIPVKELLEFVATSDNENTKNTTYLYLAGSLLSVGSVLALPTVMTALSYSIINKSKKKEIEEKAFNAIISEVNNRYNILLEKVTDVMKLIVQRNDLTDYAVYLDLSKVENSNKPLLDKLLKIKKS